MITWNNLKPKVVSACTPTIKELNIETAAVEQVYYVKAKTDTGTETYQMKEFYRVRYINRPHLSAVFPAHDGSCL